MLKLLQILIFGHFHQWKIIKNGTLTVLDVEDPLLNKRITKGCIYILQCEICGNVKQKTLTIDEI